MRLAEDDIPVDFVSANFAVEVAAMIGGAGVELLLLVDSFSIWDLKDFFLRID
jgi:hypothetical protein